MRSARKVGLSWGWYSMHQYCVCAPRMSVAQIPRLRHSGCRLIEEETYNNLSQRPTVLVRIDTSSIGFLSRELAHCILPVFILGIDPFSHEKRPQHESHAPDVGRRRRPCLGGFDRHSWGGESLAGIQEPGVAEFLCSSGVRRDDVVVMC